MDAVLCTLVAVMKLLSLSTLSWRAKFSLAEYPLQGLIVIQELIVLDRVLCHQPLQVVLDSLSTKLAHRLALLDAAPALATLGAQLLCTP